jgi:hypothetical protein
MDNTGGLNGIAYHILNWYLSIVGSAISSGTNISTLPHEMGHDFGLYHTFETFNGARIENVARTGLCTNCTYSGDQLCDTEADPENTPVDNNCIYTGTALDGCNMPYTPNTHNIMTYGNRSCRDFFTLGQGSRARFYLESLSYMADLIAPDDVYIGIFESANMTTGKTFVLARNTVVINSPSYLASGSAQLNVSAHRIQLEPGVRFSPETGGYTKIRSNTLCQ